jgi:acyl dehydratase
MSSPEVPQSLSLLCGPVRAVDLSLYAAASGDHNPLHLDEDTARAAGFDRPVVHGMLSMAYAGRLMTQHFGAASLAHLHTRFTGVALRGQTLHLKATLEGFEGDLAHYGIEAHNEQGRQVLTGTAHVRKMGGAWPAI